MERRGRFDHEFFSFQRSESVAPCSQRWDDRARSEKPSMSRRGIAIAFVLLTARTGLAETETIRVSYDAPELCPAESEFESEMRARTAKVAFGEDGRAFDVSVETGESGFVGRLAITEPDGTRNDQSLDGADCTEVVSGLALIAALAVDPEASTVPRTELFVPAEKPPPTEPPPPPRAPPKPARAMPPSLPAAPVPAHPLHIETGIGLVAVSGPAPELLIAGRVEIELSTRLDPFESSDQPRRAWSANRHHRSRERSHSVSVALGTARGVSPRPRRNLSLARMPARGRRRAPRRRTRQRIHFGPSHAFLRRSRHRSPLWAVNPSLLLRYRVGRAFQSDPRPLRFRGSESSDPRRSRSELFRRIPCRGEAPVINSRSSFHQRH